MKIVIQTNADFTPAGKRNARVVTCTRGAKQLRWYVSGKLYRHLSPTPANLAMTQKWIGA